MEVPAPPSRLVDALAGRYRLERELGAGGMATVYLAEDLRHSRKVAIKVLKPELAAVLGGDRFLTEIKTTANLQHPHILPLFDSGEADTYLFYVMPFVEGESLRDRLSREHQLGVDDAVRITRDVADALDYAHRHGVIHRDIKPENILLHDGRPLVADFGIALAISAAGGGRMTETGLSLGTPHYMSPEQASAERDLSARSDVYSLGCVLYEMLAGEPPHTGPTAASILMRILTEQPRAISDLRPTVPPHVASAVAKAVEKLPADRFETARGFRDALEDPAFRFTRTAPSTVAAPAAMIPAASRRSWDRRSIVLGTAAALLAVTTAGLALNRNRTASPAAAEEMLAFELVDSVTPNFWPFAGPNGWLGYVQNGQLFVRPPGSLTARALDGVNRVQNRPSFSPDGEWVVYAGPEESGTSQLRKITSRGGNPQSLATVAGNALAQHWSNDGWIYTTGGAPGSWFAARVPENGGTVDTLFRARTFIPYHFTTRPGLNRVVFALFNASATNPRIVSLDLGSRDTTTLIENGYSPALSASGMLFFARSEGSLFGVPLDAAGNVAGSPLPVLDSLAESSPAPRYDISPSGTLVYVSGQMIGGTLSNYALGLDSLNGGHERIALPPSDHWDAKISPDGRRVAYIRNDHLWTYDLDLGTHTQLTHAGARHHNPAWSPDGQRIAFGADTGQSSVDVYVAGAGGSAAIERFGGTPGDDYPAQWLGDTAVLVYTQGLYGQNIYLLRRGAAEPTPLLVADWVERSPRISHDGRWLAYVSNESGRNEIYVRTWPGLANKVQITGGDDPVTINSFPLWSNDDRALYYRQGSQLVAATLDPRGDSLRVTGRRVMRENQRGVLQDLHPDGRRFLVLAEVERPQATGPRAPDRLVVITNWLANLARRSARSGPQSK